jgi:hypothetical protein
MSTKDFFLWLPSPCLNLCLWRSTEVKMIFIGTKKEEKKVSTLMQTCCERNIFLLGGRSVQSKNMKLITASWSRPSYIFPNIFESSGSLENCCLILFRVLPRLCAFTGD